MARWDWVAFLGVAVMTVSVSVGLYLIYVGYDVAFYTIISLWVGAMIATVGFVYWGEEKGLEEDFMREFLAKYRKLGPKKPEKVLETEIYAASFKGLTSAFFYIVPFFTGFSLCALIFGFISGSAEAVFISVVLIIFLAWLYRWARRAQERLRRLQLRALKPVRR